MSVFLTDSATSAIVTKLILFSAALCYVPIAVYVSLWPSGIAWRTGPHTHAHFLLFKKHDRCYMTKITLNNYIVNVYPCFLNTYILILRLNKKVMLMLSVICMRACGSRLHQVFFHRGCVHIQIMTLCLHIKSRHELSNITVTRSLPTHKLQNTLSNTRLWFYGKVIEKGSRKRYKPALLHVYLNAN